jgi:mono/diheme cytochrome c family protein
VRRIMFAILAIIVVGGLAVLFGLFRSTAVAPEYEKPLSTAEMQALIPKGRELALAGDCFGCHSRPSGPMLAGGVPIATPFGVIHSSNITPDPTYGIGKYTRADFHRALRDGMAPGGRNLYPAMPYVYTHLTRPEDADAIYAYIMSLPPIAQPTPENTGVFRLPVRMFMNFWDLLNFPDHRAPQRADRSEGWNRGAYLVEGLGHCGSCHTPMNFMMGPDFSKQLQGAVIEGYEAPPLTSAALTSRGYDIDTLTTFLATGIAPQGTAFGGMYTVTHFSTSAMERKDVEAIATYLLTDATGRVPEPKQPPAPLPEAQHPAAGSPMDRGRLTYAAACAGCHGLQGEGIPNVAPAMKGNATLVEENPLNVLTVVVNGVPVRKFTGNQRLYAMPPFAHRLANDEIADLVTWLRAEWGGRDQPVTPEAVAAIPRSVE